LVHDSHSRLWRFLQFCSALTQAVSQGSEGSSKTKTFAISDGFAFHTDQDEVATMDGRRIVALVIVMGLMIILLLASSLMITADSRRSLSPVTVVDASREFSKNHAASLAVLSSVDMSKDRETALMKARCPNCKASLLVKPSVKRCTRVWHDPGAPG
jgi:DNA-directed RNA polymerase subunit RPC12/RpoP